MIQYVVYLLQLMPTLVTAVASAIAVTFIRTVVRKVLWDDAKPPSRVNILVNVSPATGYTAVANARTSQTSDISSSASSSALNSSSSSSCNLVNSSPSFDDDAQAEISTQHRDGNNQRVEAQETPGTRARRIFWTIYHQIKTTQRSKSLLVFAGIQLLFMLVAGMQSVLMHERDLVKARTRLYSTNMLSSEYQNAYAQWHALIQHTPARMFFGGIAASYDPIGVVYPIGRTLLTYITLAFAYTLGYLWKSRWLAFAAVTAAFVFLYDQYAGDVLGIARRQRQFTRSLFATLVTACTEKVVRAYQKMRNTKKKLV